MITWKITLVITYLLSTGITVGPQYPAGTALVATENEVYWTPAYQRCQRMVEALEKRTTRVNGNAYAETYECVVTK